jgi:hypothetical protein
MSKPLRAARGAWLESVEVAAGPQEPFLREILSHLPSPRER